MKKQSISITAIILTVCILFSAMPLNIYALSEEKELSDLDKLRAGMVTAEEIYGKLDESSVPEIVGYDYAVSKSHVRRLHEEEGEKLNELVFLNADGSKTLYVYDYPVKYVDKAGAIKDITLDIASSDAEGEFQTLAGSSITTFSRNASDGIGLVGNGESVSLVPHLPSVISSTLMSANSKAVTNDSVAKQIDSKTVSYTYDSKTSIEYSLTYTGFKEDIVVSEYTGQTEYDFTLHTNGLELVEIDGSFYLVDSTDTVKATLGDIIIFTADEKNNTFGDMTAKQ